MPVYLIILDDKMTYMQNTAYYLYFVMIGLVVLQFFMLLVRNVGFLPVWTLIEYMQLIAFMPIYNFKLIPYLYDTFKPFLVSHLILFNDSIFYPELNEEFFNTNYLYYNLPIGKLIQSLFNIMILLVLVVLTNIFVGVLALCCGWTQTRFGNFISSRLSQFRFNAYLRFFMLTYFDFTFFSVMKIQDKNNSSSIRKVALFFSYIFFVVSIVAPVFFVALILKRFELFKNKEAKKNYNSLVLKIDKNNKWRVIHVAFFFGRRLITAILLTLPITSQFIFLQYVFILVTSHAYILYMVATKPFQTPVMNSYILANETFYSALIILIFIFSDATP